VVLNRATDQPFGTSYQYGGYYGQPRPKP